MLQDEWLETEHKFSSTNSRIPILALLVNAKLLKHKERWYWSP